MQTESPLFSRGRQQTATAGIAAAVLMVMIGVCYAQWRRYDRANREAALTSDAVDSVSQLLSTLVDAESAERGFVLTGENRFLESYDRAVQEIPKELKTIGGLVGVRQSESGIVAQLKQLVAQRLGEFRGGIDLRRTQGAAPEPAALANEGRQTMQKIRSVCDEIQRGENSARRQASLDGEAAAQIALLITVVGSLILLFFFAIGFEPFLTRGSGDRERRWVPRYGVAVITVIAATLLRMALAPLVGSGSGSIPFVTFFPAILFAAWYGGFRAGAFALLLSVLATDYFFLVPEGSLRPRGAGELASLLIFVIVGFGLAFMSDSQRRAVARAEIAEDAEKQERRRFETTLGSIGDAVIATDATGRVTFANKVALSLTAWPEEEIAGQHLDEVFRIVNEQSRRKVESPVARVLRVGAIVGLANHTVLIARDGKEVPIDDSAAPIRSGSGAIQGTVLVFRDITARRASEKQFLAQTAELQRANEELSQFAYVVSHDLREPLRTVVNFSELLIREQGIAPDSEAATYAKFIQDSVHRMELLLNDLLAYSQLGGPHERPHRLINMNEIVEEARQNLKATIAETGAEIVSEELPEVFGYERQLLEVLQNLISNAIKYRSDRPPRISIRAERKGRNWVFSVRDNGIGIAETYRQTIFGVFKRLHGQEIPGNGIGLAICSKVVERHGGEIWVESQVGEGSEFFFTLPVNVAGRAASFSSTAR